MSNLTELKDILVNTKIFPLSLAVERTMTTGETLGYRRLFPIQESGQPLVENDGIEILRTEPHPYREIGAQYGTNSPYSVRAGVYQKLCEAQDYLTEKAPGYRLKIYDAYRPLAVQAFMVEYEFKKLVGSRNLKLDALSLEEKDLLMSEVLMFWAKPDPNPLCPPPHSTGAAVDLTLVDETGAKIDMGSEIDAIGEISFPNYFLNKDSEKEKSFHANRELLKEVMHKAGFQRLAHEWWHFSYGDQVWALMKFLETDEIFPAIYGRVE
jgi:D-alanyl-D-alanine dipeptidase